MRKTVYGEDEIKKYVARMDEPMRHQIQDAMYLKIPKEYIQVLVNKKLNFSSRAYLIGCMLDQENSETINALAQKESVEEMCLERRKLQEENFKESPIFEEYRKLADIYRKLIERVTTDQNRYQETIQAVFEKVSIENKKNDMLDQSEQQEEGDLQYKKREIKKLQELTAQMENENKGLKSEVEDLNIKLSKVQQEKEQLQKRICFVQSFDETKRESDQSGTGLIVWHAENEKPKMEMPWNKLLKKLSFYIKTRQKDRMNRKRRKYVLEYIEQNNGEADKVEIMTELYEDGWNLEEMQKIAQCKTLEEMKQMTENIKRIRMYRNILKQKKVD